MQVFNEPKLLKSGTLNVDQTLTVFIHGFKGNEYDLSKIKSHLNLLLGFTHFYSIKKLNSEEAAKHTIAELAKTAAEEINSFLAFHQGYRQINIIGFSLGGIIARAMLPKI